MVFGVLMGKVGRKDMVGLYQYYKEKKNLSYRLSGLKN